MRPDDVFAEAKQQQIYQQRWADRSGNRSAGRTVAILLALLGLAIAWCCILLFATFGVGYLIYAR